MIYRALNFIIRHALVVTTMLLVALLVSTGVAMANYAKEQTALDRLAELRKQAVDEQASGRCYAVNRVDAETGHVEVRVLCPGDQRWMSRTVATKLAECARRDQ